MSGQGELGSNPNQVSMRSCLFDSTNFRTSALASGSSCHCPNIAAVSDLIQKVTEFCTEEFAIIALCIIYNRSYIKNIEVLDRLYSSSFDRILHIVPNHRKPQKNILTAYRSSHVFQGYLADNRSAIEALGADHIAFAADDCLLNCRCILDRVTVGIDRARASGFFAAFGPPLAASSAWKWAHTLPIVSRFFGSPRLANPQVEGWLECLPDLERARSALGRYDAAELRLEKPTSDDLAKYSAIDRASVAALFGEALAIELPFPFVRGLTDFWVLTKDSVAEFLHYCGVFSSVNLWMEVAIRPQPHCWTISSYSPRILV